MRLGDGRPHGHGFEEGHRPAAVCESPIGVLALAARGLDDSVETHEVAQHDAHHSCPFCCRCRMVGAFRCRPATCRKLTGSEHVAIYFGRSCRNPSQPWCSSGLFGTSRRLDDFVSRSGPMPTTETTTKPIPICPPGSISPTPTSTPNGCRSRNWPRCAGPRRSGGTSSRSGIGGFDDGGFWVVTKHKDVKEVSRAQRGLLQPEEDRAAPLQGRHGR